MFAVEPVWQGLKPAAEAIGLADFTVLHAGPPVTETEMPVQPILNSAALAALFEGWAQSMDEALSLVHAGRIRFQAAQYHSVVTPLAAVVSPSMLL